jgi:predicted DNA binding CopG/RHH family protein
MREHYDFSKGRKNPYVRRLKKAVTIRLDVVTLEYFRELAAGLGLPYQTLINMYLLECAMEKKQLRLQWRPRRKSKK